MPSALEQARAALEPFADVGRVVGEDESVMVKCLFRPASLRAAAVALARLSALTPPDETEWARVVDPEAWTFEPWNENWTTVMVARRESALAKARTLIGMAK